MFNLKLQTINVKKETQKHVHCNTIMMYMYKTPCSLLLYILFNYLKSFFGQLIGQLLFAGINTHVQRAFLRALRLFNDLKTQIGVTVGLKQFVVKHREASCVNGSNGRSLVRRAHHTYCIESVRVGFISIDSTMRYNGRCASLLGEEKGDV